jgi:hypothetical protein
MVLAYPIDSDQDTVLCREARSSCGTPVLRSDLERVEASNRPLCAAYRCGLG